MLKLWVLHFGAMLWTLASLARGGTTVTNLVTFQVTTNNGSFPSAPLVQGADGIFYGTTQSGGAHGQGTVFQMTPNGTLNTLFPFGGTNGGNPMAALLLATDGNLYGTTSQGGTNGKGTIFQISTNGSLSSLYSFSGNDGTSPQAGMVEGSDGNFYGTTYGGGSNGNGTLFRITTNGTFASLISFNGTNGLLPGALVEGADGVVYGVTQGGGTNYPSAAAGTIFRITTNGAFTSLVSFNGTNGSWPYALVLGRDGNLYGATAFGGTNTDGSHASGVVFQFTTNGLLTTVGLCPGLPDFNAGFVAASDGDFYGITQDGPAIHWTVFQMTPAGVVTTVASFSLTGDTDPQGRFPYGLMQGSDGDFYGVTQGGGSPGDGTIFRLSVPMPPAFQPISQSNGTNTLTWSTVAGQTYQLQYTTDLSSSNWINLGDTIIASGGTASTNDSFGPDSQRFYRVVLLP